MRAAGAAPSPAVLDALACCYRDAGMYQEAVETWQEAVDGEPRPAERRPLRRRLADALTDWGTALKLDRREPPGPAVARDRFAEALDRYRRALAVDPDHALAHYNTGAVHAELGRLDLAVRSFRRAVKRDPALADAHVGLGFIARERGDLEESIRRHRKALRAQPGHAAAARCLAEALTDLGNQKKSAGALGDAVKLYRRAIRHDARNALAWYNLGVAHGAAGRPRRSKTCYEIALVLNPSFPDASYNLGIRLSEEGDLDRALVCYEQAAALHPGHVAALNNMGGVYALQGRIDEARDAVRRALAIEPGNAAAWSNLGMVAHFEGDLDAVLRCYERALQCDRDNREIQHNVLMIRNYLADRTLAAAHADHAAWAHGFEERTPPLPPPRRSFDPERPLRVGYLSPDFVTHSVAYFIEGVLANHSPGCLAYCYSQATREDETSARLRRLVAGFRPTHGMSAEQVAACIRRDEIDLLIDLAGHTAGNRLDVMALRPAPVQLTYLGYPNTTGLTRIDHRITDALADPLDTAQRYSEALLRVPGCFLCYTPPRDAPPVGPPPHAARGHVTFVSFNNAAKLNDRVLALWGRVLAAAPEARLLLKNRTLATPSGRERLLGRLERHGVRRDRVECLLPLVATTAHLAAYGGADISLDTFPYAGTTTTCEALLMGVSVVTLSGSSHAHNVGRSLLHAVGLPELVARTDDEYVAIARDLALHPARLAALRSTLRERLLRSPLCDAPAFTRRLEDAYRTAWRERCGERAGARVQPCPAQTVEALAS
jgi:predicted O-linked N-acetylglucosamine transferase (SPINDLY family)